VSFVIAIPDYDEKIKDGGVGIGEAHKKIGMKT
jgi:hypothetical protein